MMDGMVKVEVAVQVEAILEAVVATVLAKEAEEDGSMFLRMRNAWSNAELGCVISRSCSLMVSRIVSVFVLSCGELYAYEWYRKSSEEETAVKSCSSRTSW